MSDYTAAPATILLATQCACCARPLLDAVSVETGVGPDCRKKHGFTQAQTEPNWTDVLYATDGIISVLEIFGEKVSLGTLNGEAVDAAWRLGGIETRRVANVIVHRIAAEQDSAGVPDLINAVRALGFTKLADRIATRVAPVRIELQGNELVVTAPYSEKGTAAFRRVPGRRWDRDAKVNRFPMSAKRDLFDALRDAFPGLVAAGPKGLFTISA